MKIMKEEIQHIELKSIVTDEHQPRKYFDPLKIRYLKDSINKYGIMNPLTVEKIGEKYLLVDGERRYRAATELKMKDVPAVIIAPQSSVDRLIQQFHIQEQHEGWSTTEKAMVVYQLSQELKISVVSLGEMLGLEKSSISRYVAFSSLLEKKEFEKTEMSIRWASPILAVKSLVKNMYENELNKPFTQEDERKIEKAIIYQIKIGELKSPSELTKLKDAFKQAPKEIETFLEKGKTVSQMFIDTKAKSAYHLRNAVNNAGYAAIHILRYMENPHVKPTKENITQIRQAFEATKKFLNTIE